MKALIQRVSRGSVSVDGKIESDIGRGFVVLLGVMTVEIVNEGPVTIELDSNGE